MHDLRSISLFSGAGGLDVGFERAGFGTLFANEFDHHTPDFGVPENRDRVIFIGVRREVGRTDDFYRELNSHHRKPATLDTILAFQAGFNPAELLAHVRKTVEAIGAIEAQMWIYKRLLDNT